MRHKLATYSSACLTAVLSLFLVYCGDDSDDAMSHLEGARHVTATKVIREYYGRWPTVTAVKCIHGNTEYHYSENMRGLCKPPYMRPKVQTTLQGRYRSTRTKSCTLDPKRLYRLEYVSARDPEERHHYAVRWDESTRLVRLSVPENPECPSSGLVKDNEVEIRFIDGTGLNSNEAYPYEASKQLQHRKPRREVSLHKDAEIYTNSCIDGPTWLPADAESEHLVSRLSPMAWYTEPNPHPGVWRRGPRYPGFGLSRVVVKKHMRCSYLSSTHQNEPLLLENYEHSSSLKADYYGHGRTLTLLVEVDFEGPFWDLWLRDPWGRSHTLTDRRSSHGPNTRGAFALTLSTELESRAKNADDTWTLHATGSGVLRRWALHELK